MAELNLSKYGITGTTEVVHNPSYDLLFEEETKSTNEGYEKGQVSELGAVNVMTGIYTGRSPKDNPKGPEQATERIARGGSWYNYEGLVRNSTRIHYPPAERFVNVGFRCARDLVPPAPDTTRAKTTRAKTTP